MCVYAMLCETLDRPKRKEPQLERGLNLERGLHLELPSSFEEPRPVSLYSSLSCCFAVIKRERTMGFDNFFKLCFCWSQKVQQLYPA